MLDPSNLLMSSDRQEFLDTSSNTATDQQHQQVQQSQRIAMNNNSQNQHQAMFLSSSQASVPQTSNIGIATNQTGTSLSNNNNASTNDAQQQNLNIANELKRFQQYHQLSTGSGGGNALLMPTGSQASSTVPNPAAFLQSMLDQKVQNPRFEEPLRQANAPATQNNMLPVGFLADNRFLMTPNQFGIPNFTQNQSQQAQTGSEMPLPSPHSLFHRDGSRRMRGGVIEPFPEKLHRLLLEVEAAGRGDVISFVVGGRAFIIHKPDKFFKDIVPLYFRQSRLSSFKRQLNLYGFELINTGPARGGYYHELFVKDHPDMCRRMRRVAIKLVSKSGDQDTEGEKKAQDESTLHNNTSNSGPFSVGAPGGNIEWESAFCSKSRKKKTVQCHCILIHRVPYKYHWKSALAVISSIDFKLARGKAGHPILIFVFDSLSSNTKYLLGTTSQGLTSGTAKTTKVTF